jgi:predicted  nucleic acid-binding Zn-ribbon protein
VDVVVRPAGSDAVVNGLVGAWPTDLGERPALWIPASSVSSARLQALAGKQIVSDARSLAATPVVLALRPQLAAALGVQGWAALPALQTNPTSLDPMNLPGWGSLRLALPIDGTNDATYLAAEAVAISSAPPGAPPTAGLGAVSALLGGQPQLAENNATEAWNALVAPGDPAAAGVHAVAMTEQQLFSRASNLPNAKDVVAQWIPDGPVAMADYPTVLLAGDWLSEEQVSAASEFARFMGRPEQLEALARAGFRAEGTTPPAGDVVSFPALAAPLQTGDDAMRAAVAAAVAAARHADDAAMAATSRAEELEARAAALSAELDKARKEARHLSAKTDAAVRDMVAAQAAVDAATRDAEAARKEAAARAAERDAEAEALRRERTRAQRAETDAADSLSRASRLERAASGGHGSGSEFSAENAALRKMLNCNVCHTRLKNRIITKCNHIFCSHCIDANLATRHRKCPGCGEKFSASDVKQFFFT